MRLCANVLTICISLSLSSVSGFIHKDCPRAQSGAGSKGGTQQTAPSADTIYEAGEVDRKAVILSKPYPELTQEAIERKLQGRVLLRLVLSSAGQVTDIEVLKGLPAGLTKKAIKAARGIRFVPAVKAGSPVSTRVQIEYHLGVWEKTYYGDRSKMVYYKDGCKDYANIKPGDLIDFLSEKEAKEAGYKQATAECP